MNILILNWYDSLGKLCESRYFKNHYPVISNDCNINLKIQIGQKFWESWNKLSAMMKRKISVYSTCRSYFKFTVAKTLIRKGQSEAGKLDNWKTK